MYRSHFVTRMHGRFQVEAPISFAKNNTDNLLDGKMRNISDGGMYFETKYPVEPWSSVFIWLDKKPSEPYNDIKIYDFYRSRVQWCQEIKKSDVLGIGVKHVNRTCFVLGPEFTCSFCDTKIPLGSVYFLKDFVYCCPDCRKNLENWVENNTEEILRFAEGNVL